MGRWRSKNKRNQITFRIFLFLLIFSLSTLAVDKAIRPSIESKAAINGKIEAQKIIYSTARRSFLELKEEASSLVKISYDNQNKITAVETNTALLGVLTNEISQNVALALSKIENEEFTLRLGSLIGSSFFAGRGPEIKFRIETGGFLETNIQSLFEEAGINQTRHIIRLDLKVNITVFIPGYPSTTVSDASLIISDTIIVGAVPENFVSIPLISEKTAIK